MSFLNKPPVTVWCGVGYYGLDYTLFGRDVDMVGGGQRCNRHPPPLGGDFCDEIHKKEREIRQKCSIRPSFEGASRNPHPPRGGRISVPVVR